MMPPLTEEQKRHMKESNRATQRINETWSLFTLYLQQDKRPEEALELARKAVEIWADFMDATEIEPPEIEPPDIMKTMTQVAEAVGERLQRIREGGDLPGGAIVIQGNDAGITRIDAEFEPEPPPVPEPPVEKDPQ